MQLNYWAILVAAFVPMVLGFLWWSPALFGKRWLHVMGWTKEDMEKKKQGMTAKYLMMFVGALVMSYILAHFANYAGAKDWVGGLQAAFWAWLGFVMASSLGAYLFEGRKWDLFWINGGFHLVSMLLMGAIIGGWRV